MPTKTVSEQKAAWIGLAWVTGSVLAAYVVAFAVLAWGFTTQKALVDWLGPWSLLGVLFALLAPWLVWSFQVTRWRIWAYRRVSNIESLKVEAAALSVIWPSGHFFERTEFRSASQKRELERLEQSHGRA